MPRKKKWLKQAIAAGQKGAQAVKAQAAGGAAGVRRGEFVLLPLGKLLGEVHRTVLLDAANALDTEDSPLGTILWEGATTAKEGEAAEFLFQDVRPPSEPQGGTGKGDGKRANFSIGRMRHELEEAARDRTTASVVDPEELEDACRAFAAAVSELAEARFTGPSPGLSSDLPTLVLREDTKELVMSCRGANVQPTHADGDFADIYKHLEAGARKHKKNTARERAVPLSILAAMGQPFTVLTSPYSNEQESALWKWTTCGGDISESHATRKQTQIHDLHKTLDFPDPLTMKRVVVPAFHALFFHQGRVHCGDATSDPYNLRFHAYYDHADVVVPPGEAVTYAHGWYEHGQKVADYYYAKPVPTSEGRTRATTGQEAAVRAALALHKDTTRD